MRFGLISVMAFSILPLGCSKERIYIPKANSPPTIRFAFEKLAVPRGLDVELSVEVSDPDDDPLTVHWEVTRGQIRDEDQGKPQVTWTPPTTPGTDSVRVSVSDGKITKRIMETVKVGTRWTLDITEITRWVIGNSPYIIDPSSIKPSPDRIVIDTLVTLTIEPGVEVLIDKPGILIDVEGAGVLLSQGTPSSRVVIRPNRRDPQPGFWKGIYADISATVHLEFTAISYALYSLQMEAESAAFLNGCKLTFSGSDCIWFRSHGCLRVEECLIADNLGSGIRADFRSGSLPDSVTILRNTIRFNKNSGVDIEMIDSSGMVPVDIRYNNISHNEIHGIKLAQSVYPEIHQNVIHSNGYQRINNGYDIRLVPGFFGVLPNIDARYNYWGMAYEPQDSLQIAERIWDRRDSANITAKLWYSPWLDSMPDSVGTEWWGGGY